MHDINQFKYLKSMIDNHRQEQQNEKSIYFKEIVEAENI